MSAEELRRVCEAFGVERIGDISWEDLARGDTVRRRNLLDPLLWRVESALLTNCRYVVRRYPPAATEYETRIVDGTSIVSTTALSPEESFVKACGQMLDRQMLNEQRSR